MKNSIQALEPLYQQAVQKALIAQSRAYAPYSKFQVGAVAISKEGNLYSGCNIENVGFTLTVHAEVMAISQLVSIEPQGFASMVIVTPTQAPLFPCGQCRQFLAEFGLDVSIIAVEKTGHYYEEKSLGELLPYHYDKGHWEEK